MLEQSYYDEADKIIAAYGTEPRFLIPIIRIFRANISIFRRNYYDMWRTN